MAFGGTVIGRGVIPVTVDKSAVDRDLDNLERESKGRFSRIGTAAKAGMALATGGAALGIAKFVGDSIGRASDLGEVLSKSTQIFGRDALPMLEKFADGAARSIGQSKTAALDAAATFGTFGKIAGKSGKDLAGFSIDMTKLASDMASFGNTSPEEAVQALGAALRGESEPIRRYGVMLDDATLKAEALALGILKPVKDEGKIKAYRLRIIEQQKDYNDAVAEYGPKSMEALKAEAALETTRNSLRKATEGTIPPLTAQQKVLAAQSSIMKQTKDQQGDFARTSDGLANQQRILKAQFEDLSTSIGQKFLPIAVGVAQWANDDLIPGIIKAGEWLGVMGGKFAAVGGFIADNVVWFGALAAAIGVVAAAMAAHSLVLAINSGALALWFHQTTLVQTATKAWAAIQWVLNAALSANPIGIVVVALAALAGGIYLAWQRSSTFREIVTAAFEKVQEVVGGVVGWFRDTFVPFFTEKIPNAFGAVKDWVEQHWKAAWGKIQDWIIDPVKGGKDAVVGFFGEDGPVRSAFNRVKEWVENTWKSAWNKVEDWVINPVKGGKDAIVGFFGEDGPVRGAFNRVQNWVETAWKATWDKVESWVISPVRNAKEAIVGFFGEEGPIRSAFNRVQNWVETAWKATWDKVEGWILDPIRTAKNVIQNIMGTGDDGVGPIQRAFQAAVDAVQRIWNGIKKAAAVPVNFVIETVWNNGLREVIGKIPGVDTPGKVGLIEWEEKAEGGPITGGIPGRDSVRALLMPGEHVWTTEEVKRAGGHHAMRRMRELAKKGRLRAGRVGDPGWDLAPGFASGGNLSFDMIQRAKMWAQQQVGKPYIWGGTGPGGFDCSGFMSGIVNVLRGGDGFGTRYGTTATFPWSGFQPGYGEFTIGNSKRVGHMGGTLAGLDVESTNGSVRIGAIARGASHPLYEERYHLGKAGADAGGERSGFWDAIDAIKDIWGKVGGWLEELKSMGGWGGLVKEAVSGIVGNLKSWIDDKIPGPSIFDKGGMLRPGMIGMNRSRKAERVLSARQTLYFERLVDFAEQFVAGRPARSVRTVDYGNGSTMSFVERDPLVMRLNELLDAFRDAPDRTAAALEPLLTELARLTGQETAAGVKTGGIAVARRGRRDR